jgi:hypothetical protein
MNTRHFPGGNERPEFKADLTNICVPIVYKMLNPQRLPNLLASTAYYGESFSLSFYLPEVQQSIQYLLSIST